jgi:hypothetical protein
MRTLQATLLSFFILVLCVNAFSQTSVVEIVTDESGSTSKKSDSPLTNLVNKPNVSDAYPFLSADGLRLYFTSNREGGHGRFFISKRSSVSDPFGEPEILSKNLTDGYYAGSLTLDELTMVMVKAGKVYISQRPDRHTTFEDPKIVEGISPSFHFAPAISPDGSEIICLALEIDKKLRVYKRVSRYHYYEAGIMPIPEKGVSGPGQFSKDGLNYYFSFETAKNKVSIWRFARRTLSDRFVDLEELPVKVNSFRRNFQPSVNDNASIIAYTTSQNNRWEENDIILVNNEAETFAGQEIFTSVEKNQNETVTIKSKMSSTMVRAFPNPFQHQITVELKEVPKANTVFILYDISGRILKQERLVGTINSIQLAELPAATYIYQVLDKKRTVLTSGKLVKG